VHYSQAFNVQFRPCTTVINQSQKPLGVLWVFNFKLVIVAFDLCKWSELKPCAQNQLSIPKGKEKRLIWLGRIGRASSSFARQTNGDISSLVNKLSLKQTLSKQSLQIVIRV